MDDDQWNPKKDQTTTDKTQDSLFRHPSPFQFVQGVHLHQALQVGLWNLLALVYLSLPKVNVERKRKTEQQNKVGAQEHRGDPSWPHRQQKVHLLISIKHIRINTRLGSWQNQKLLEKRENAVNRGRFLALNSRSIHSEQAKRFRCTQWKNSGRYQRRCQLDEWDRPYRLSAQQDPGARWFLARP